MLSTFHIKYINQFFVGSQNIEKMKMIYDSVYDVDLLVGLNLEEKNGYMGDITRCIIGIQFYRLKQGDRYFYTNVKSPNPFTNGTYLLLISRNTN